MHRGGGGGGGGARGGVVVLAEVEEEEEEGECVCLFGPSIHGPPCMPVSACLPEAKQAVDDDAVVAAAAEGGGGGGGGDTWSTKSPPAVLSTLAQEGDPAREERREVDREDVAVICPV